MKDIICYICGKNGLNKNETGLNKKLLGRGINKYYCLDCLAQYLEVTTDFLVEKAKEFRKQGCSLFE
jgi:uncharacterized protein YlaI